jgi:NAD+ diphosphatase
MYGTSQNPGERPNLKPTVHVYSGNPLDRGERERRDEAWITARADDPRSRFLPLRDLNILVSGDGLAWLGADDLTRHGIEAAPVFLGLLDGRAHFAVEVSGVDGAAGQFDAEGESRFEDARTAAGYLSGPDAGIAAQARAQLDWHKRHRFCSVCGHESQPKRGGQKRECPNCQAEHFPRTDPVVITVVSDGDRCLLGQSRGRLRRMRMYSALAGFVDQAESIEEAVAREIKEEAGISVGNIRYHSSQPWPFPSSLMIGCHADAVTTEIAMDEEEMTDVQWFHRDEVLRALEGNNAELAVPQPLAIAHHLIKAWANGEA